MIQPVSGFGVPRVDRGAAVAQGQVETSDERGVLGLSDLTAEGVIKLSFGKKRHVLLRPI